MKIAIVAFLSSIFGTEHVMNKTMDRSFTDLFRDGVESSQVEDASASVNNSISSTTTRTTRESMKQRRMRGNDFPSSVGDDNSNIKSESKTDLRKKRQLAANDHLARELQMMATRKQQQQQKQKEDQPQRRELQMMELMEEMEEKAPSDEPSFSFYPSATPSEGPSDTPTTTIFPSVAPTTNPSDEPSFSFYPSSAPSEVPSDSPTTTVFPSASPTDELSDEPSFSFYPSTAPSDAPSDAPSGSTAPSDAPSWSPSDLPSLSVFPSDSPTDSTSDVPTVSPMPSAAPTTSVPTFSPTMSPSDFPTIIGTPGGPTITPTGLPTGTPSEDMCIVPLAIVSTFCDMDGGTIFFVIGWPEDESMGQTLQVDAMIAVKNNIQPDKESIFFTPGLVVSPGGKAQESVMIPVEITGPLPELYTFDIMINAKATGGDLPIRSCMGNIPTKCTPSMEGMPTASPIVMVTDAPTITASPTSTDFPTATLFPTATHSPTYTLPPGTTAAPRGPKAEVPTSAGDGDSSMPSDMPSLMPSTMPSMADTIEPGMPTASPMAEDSSMPSDMPSLMPTKMSGTMEPETPTAGPTMPGTMEPGSPTAAPTEECICVDTTPIGTKPLTCKEGESSFELSFTFDAFPGDISWALVGGDGEGPVLATGSGYNPLLNGKTIVASKLCVPKNACYTFIIRDSQGDGMCCMMGTGNYKIEIDKGADYFEGGIFQKHESVGFCVEEST